MGATTTKPAMVYVLQASWDEPLPGDSAVIGAYTSMEVATEAAEARNSYREGGRVAWLDSGDGKRLGMGRQDSGSRLLFTVYELEVGAGSTTEGPKQ